MEVCLMWLEVFERKLTRGPLLPGWPGFPAGPGSPWRERAFSQCCILTYTTQMTLLNTRGISFYHIYQNHQVIKTPFVCFH